jgi:hypothetical protein
MCGAPTHSAYRTPGIFDGEAVYEFEMVTPAQGLLSPEAAGQVEPLLKLGAKRAELSQEAKVVTRFAQYLQLQSVLIGEFKPPVIAFENCRVLGMARCVDGGGMVLLENETGSFAQVMVDSEIPDFAWVLDATRRYSAAKVRPCAIAQTRNGDGDWIVLEMASGALPFSSR